VDGHVELTESFQRIDDTVPFLSELSVIAEVLELTAPALIENRARWLDTVRARLFHIDQAGEPVLFIRLRHDNLHGLPRERIRDEQRVTVDARHARAFVREVVDMDVETVILLDW
jgi:hypothetical protein